jgi:hypothetical protein
MLSHFLIIIVNSAIGLLHCVDMSVVAVVHGTSIFDPEDGDSMYVQNVRNIAHMCTV